MNKELLKMLEELNESLGNLLNDNKDIIEIKLQERLNKALNEKAIVSIEKFEGGKSKARIEGTNVSILIALAALEKAVFKKINPPKGCWELIKQSVGTREVEDNE